MSSEPIRFACHKAGLQRCNSITHLQFAALSPVIEAVNLPPELYSLLPPQLATVGRYHGRTLSARGCSELGKGTREQHAPPTEAVRTSCAVFIRCSTQRSVRVRLPYAGVQNQCSRRGGWWLSSGYELRGCLRMSLPLNGDEVNNNKQVNLLLQNRCDT